MNRNQPKQCRADREFLTGHDVVNSAAPWKSAGAGAAKVAEPSRLHRVSLPTRRPSPCRRDVCAALAPVPSRRSAGVPARRNIRRRHGSRTANAPFHEPPLRIADFPVGVSGRLENRRYGAMPVHGPDARPLLEVEAHHEPRSSRRKEAHSTFRTGDQSLLTSAATVQGFKARTCWGNSHPSNILRPGTGALRTPC